MECENWIVLFEESGIREPRRLIKTPLLNIFLMDHGNFWIDVDVRSEVTVSKTERIVVHQRFVQD